MLSKKEGIRRLINDGFTVVGANSVKWLLDELDKAEALSLSLSKKLAFLRAEYLIMKRRAEKATCIIQDRIKELNRDAWVKQLRAENEALKEDVRRALEKGIFGKGGEKWKR